MTDQPVPLVAASTILLVRDEPAFEVLMVRRHAKSSFMPDAMVFPGGKVDAADSAAGWAGHAQGWDGLPERERAFRVAAIRELFEETGILLAGGPDRAALAEAEREAHRARLEGKSLDFLELLRETGLSVDLLAVVPFSVWHTPVGVPMRFDTHFFVARAPHGQATLADSRETDGIEWIAPAEAVRFADSGERNIVLPTRMSLSQLGESQTTEAALAAARARPVQPVLPRLEKRDGGMVTVLEARFGFGEIVTPFVPPVRR